MADTDHFQPWLNYVKNNRDYYFRKWRLLELRESKTSWNWPAFFLGGGWLAYRKMYGYAFAFLGLIFALSILGAVFEANGASGIAAIMVLLLVALHVCSGIFGNYLYFERVKKEVRVIATLYAGENIDAELKRAGGTNLLAGIALSVLLTIAGLPLSIPAPQSNQVSSSAGSAMVCSKPIVEIKPGTFLHNGEMDFGFTVVGKVKNEGGAGSANMTAKLSTSEGSYTRSREFYFDKASTHDVTFQFHEPTVNAVDIQAVVNCSPG